MNSAPASAIETAVGSVYTLIVTRGSVYSLSTLDFVLINSSRVMGRTTAQMSISEPQSASPRAWEPNKKAVVTESHRGGSIFTLICRSSEMPWPQTVQGRSHQTSLQQSA